jgi:hypothetical protein
VGFGVSFYRFLVVVVNLHPVTREKICQSFNGQKLSLIAVPGAGWGAVAGLRGAGGPEAVLYNALIKVPTGKYR